MSTRAEQALEKHLLKMKAMGVTITSTPAAGRESDFGERPFGIIQAAADRLGIGNPPDDTLAAAGDDLRDLHDVIDRDLIVTDPPAADWRPDEKDLA